MKFPPFFLSQLAVVGITVLGAKALLQAAFPATPEVMIDAILAGVVVKCPWQSMIIKIS